MNLNLSLPFVIVAIFTCAKPLQAQWDTIYTQYAPIVCTVKEVQLSSVRYVLPDEDVLNSIARVRVEKIAFHSGRVQTFLEFKKLMPVNHAKDFRNIHITFDRDDAAGLVNLGIVNTNARSYTWLVNPAHLQERSLHKLRVAAAMLGANLLLIEQQNTLLSPVDNAAANSLLTATAYSDRILDAEAFKQFIGDRKNFKLSRQIELRSSSRTYLETLTYGAFQLGKVEQQGPFVVVTGRMNVDSGALPKRSIAFRLISYGDNSFTLYTQPKARAMYNYIIHW